MHAVKQIKVALLLTISLPVDSGEAFRATDRAILAGVSKLSIDTFILCEL